MTWSRASDDSKGSSERFRKIDEFAAATVALLIYNVASMMVISFIRTAGGIEGNLSQIGYLLWALLWTYYWLVTSCWLLVSPRSFPWDASSGSRGIIMDATTPRRPRA